MFEELKLTRAEKKRLRQVEKTIRRWRRILMLDPMWDIDAVAVDDESMQGRTAFVDLGSAEYYQATVGVTRFLLSDAEEDLFLKAMQDIGAHELVHLMTADYHRAAVESAGKNKALRKQIDYRYEQFISKMTAVLLKLDKRIRELEEE